MATRNVATVFGGSGFIGRYVVKRLAASGHVVRVVERDPEAALFLKPAGAVGQVVPLYADLSRPETIAPVVAGAEFVVNLVGILAEQHRGDFQRLHADGAGAVARAAAAAGVARLVHISAIGADPASPSQYARTKAAGEQAVRDGFPTATILRPSVVFGAEDQFFNRFAAMMAWLPMVPVVADATKFQPVYVGDVADAVMAALTRADAAGRTFELGGPRGWTMGEVMEWTLAQTRRHKLMFNMPMAVMQGIAAIAEHLPGRMLTRDQLALLQRDNIVAAGAAGLEALGVTPTPVELVVPSYLGRFRPGGAGRRVARPLLK